jgi:hypothetical protein
MVEITEGAPEHWQAEHSDVIPQRTGVVGAKEARRFGLMPRSLFPFEDSNRGEQTKYAIERTRLSSAGLRKHLCGLRIITDQICDS